MLPPLPHLPHLLNSYWMNGPTNKGYGPAIGNKTNNIHLYSTSIGVYYIYLSRAPPQPIIQESSHPYTDDITLSGHVRAPGAEALRIEFDRQCSTERRHDPLTIMDGSGRIVAVRSGREWTDWSPELRIPGRHFPVWLRNRLIKSWSYRIILL